MLIAGNLYAANGDLIVNGNVGVGTPNPQERLEVNGTIVVNIGGQRYKLAPVSGSEDYYGPTLSGGGSDTCNGDTANTYGCPFDAVKTCTDTWCFCDEEGCYPCYHRTVSCQLGNLSFVPIP